MLCVVCWCCGVCVCVCVLGFVEEAVCVVRVRGRSVVMCVAYTPHSAVANKTLSMVFKLKAVSRPFMSYKWIRLFRELEPSPVNVATSRY